MKIITLQPSARTDHITEDGTELQQLPYPFHVDESGDVRNQDFWCGCPAQIVGFTADLHRQEIDVWWHEIVVNPDRAVRLYIVSANSDGSMYTHINAVMSVSAGSVIKLMKGLIMSASQVTSDIRWLIEDAGLGFSPEFKVRTKSVNGRLVTTVYGVSAALAEQALSEYINNVRASGGDLMSRIRAYDGFLEVSQRATRLK